MEEICKWLDTEKINYYLFQLENCPKTNRIHAQGFLQLETKNTITWMKSNINSSCHFEICKKNIQTNIDYCSKEESRVDGPWHKGNLVLQGQRSDISDTMEYVKGKTTLSSDIINSTTYLKYHKGIEKIIENNKHEEITSEMNNLYSIFVLNNHQQFFFDLLKNQSNRTINWIWDEVGNIGKSEFGKYMHFIHNAFLCINGKPADIFHAYNNQDIVIIDLPRKTNVTNLNYEILENFKDGYIFKSKYDSKMIIRKSIKLIIFSNSCPDTNNMTQDRWNIFHFNGTFNAFNIN